MTDRFYLATQALKRLPAICGNKGEAAKSGVVTPDKVATISRLLDANVAKAEIADLRRELSMHDSLASRSRVAYEPYSDAQSIIAANAVLPTSNPNLRLSDEAVVTMCLLKLGAEL